MLVKYYLIQRHNPFNKEAAKKWYAMLINNRDTSYRDIISRISRYSTVNSPDVMAVLESLLQLIPEQLLEGKIVRLGELGSIRLTANSSGIENPDDFTDANIKGVNIRFSLGKTFKEQIDKIKYKRIAKPNS